MRHAAPMAAVLLAIACSDAGRGRAAEVPSGKPPSTARVDSAPAPSVAFVPGEVIVRFRPESTMGRLAQRDSTPAALTRSLQPSVAALSRDLGVPLRIKGVTSGSELLFAVGLDQLTARLAARVKTGPGVERAAEVAVSPPGPFGSTREVRVELREGSPQAQAAAAAASDAGKAAAVVESLRRGFEHPVIGRVTPQREVFLAVDGRALTLQLIERLRSRHDVAHAEPNYRLQSNLIVR